MIRQLPPRTTNPSTPKATPPCSKALVPRNAPACPLPPSSPPANLLLMIPNGCGISSLSHPSNPQTHTLSIITWADSSPSPAATAPTPPPSHLPLPLLPLFTPPSLAPSYAPTSSYPSPPSARVTPPKSVTWSSAASPKCRPSAGKSPLTPRSSPSCLFPPSIFRAES